MTTSDGEEGASVIHLDEVGWSNMSPAMYMLSQRRSSNSKTNGQQFHIFAFFVLCGSRAAVRTLPLLCVVPMATHTDNQGW